MCIWIAIYSSKNFERIEFLYVTFPEKLKRNKSPLSSVDAVIDPGVGDEG